MKILANLFQKIYEVSPRDWALKTKPKPLFYTIELPQPQGSLITKNPNSNSLYKGNISKWKKQNFFSSRNRKENRKNQEPKSLLDTKINTIFSQKTREERNSRQSQPKS